MDEIFGELPEFHGTGAAPTNAAAANDALVQAEKMAADDWYIL
jgi:hypothetical protein